MREYLLRKVLLGGIRAYQLLMPAEARARKHPRCSWQSRNGSCSRTGAELTRLLGAQAGALIAAQAVICGGCDDESADQSQRRP
jgi:hypothetical protein